MAHWIEQAGISTVVIGLIKPHLEKIRPPRALWVPFALGRPLGAPGNGELQKQVLLQALTMIESCTTATLYEFSLDDPRSQPDNTWVAPLQAEYASVSDECDALKDKYQEFSTQRGRSSVGVAKLPIEQLSELVDYVFKHKEFKSVRTDISARLMFRLALDDLKMYYTEAALATQSKPSNHQLDQWLWQHTFFGNQMNILRTQLMHSDNEKAKDLATKFIVPHAWRK